MHWHILGHGAVGCLWGARLAAGAEEVTLLVRDRAALVALRRQGAVNLTVDGNTRRIPVFAALAGEGAAIENLLVCVKAHQTRTALEGVSGRLTARSRLVFLQNGMGQLEQISPRYPDCKLYPAVTTEGAWRRDRFSVVHAGHGESWLGAYPGGVSSRRPRELIDSLQATGLAIQWDPEISARQWRKLAINCLINPLTALMGCRNGDLLLAQAERPLATLCEEVEGVLRARGVALETPLGILLGDVIRATADNRSSMLQDFEAGRETEIDYITGFLLRQAEALGMDAPANRQLYEMVNLKQALDQSLRH